MENKKKVYLVDIDNGESYEDYRHSVDKVFSTYRGASQWLIDEGYKPYEFYSYDKAERYIEFRDKMTGCTYLIEEKEVSDAEEF